MDKFISMKELQENTIENKDWHIETKDNNSDITILAIHGGGIEPATSELAFATAQIKHYNYFTFKGDRRHGNNELHVTSIHYDNNIALDLTHKSQRTISLHGCTGQDSIVYIGGKDEQLIKLITSELEDINVEVQQAPHTMSGKQKENIVNQTQIHAGVQLEITHALRKQFFKDKKLNRKSREDQSNWEEFLYTFANALVKAIEGLHD